MREMSDDSVGKGVSMHIGRVHERESWRVVFSLAIVVFFFRKYSPTATENGKAGRVGTVSIRALARCCFNRVSSSNLLTKYDDIRP